MINSEGLQLKMTAKKGITTRAATPAPPPDNNNNSEIRKSINQVIFLELFRLANVIKEIKGKIKDNVNTIVNDQVILIEFKGK